MYLFGTLNFTFLLPVGLVTLVVLVLCYLYGSLGIRVALQWPEPNCCCYSNRKVVRSQSCRNSSGSSTLLMANVILLCLEILNLLLYLVGAAVLSYIASVEYRVLADGYQVTLFVAYFFVFIHIGAVAVSSTAIFNLKKAFKANGKLELPSSSMPLAA